MATSTEPTPSNTPLCPLARDKDGYAIEVPAGAVGWRVRRKTRGRPRIVVGADKQAMQLPLTYSIVDLEDILAPAAYLLDIVDSKGAPLGITVEIEVGSLRNAADEDADDTAGEAMAVSPALPTTGSETRLVLEANVRATQMAFLHNQKTLELGLRMAETMRDSVRVLAEAQADWIKSMASVRGFFRNAAPPLPPPPAPRDDDEEDDDDDDEDEDEARPPSGPDWVEAAKPLVAIAVEQVVKAVANMGQSKPAGQGYASKFELADLLDWRRAGAKREAATQPPNVPTSEPTPDLQDLIGKIPAALLPKLLQVRSMLTADEQTRAMQMIAMLESQFVDEFVARAEAMTADELAAYLRARLAKPAA